MFKKGNENYDWMSKENDRYQSTEKEGNKKWDGRNMFKDEWMKKKKQINE